MALAAFLVAQVALRGIPSAQCLWQMDALRAQGVSNPSTRPGQACLWGLLVCSSFSNLAHLSLNFCLTVSAIFTKSPPSVDSVTWLSPGAVCFLSWKCWLLHFWGRLIASQCLSSLFFQAYQFRPLTTLLFSSLTFFFQAYEIVDVKSFGVFLLPLLGIDLYALCAGLKKCRSEWSQNIPMTSACGVQASTTSFPVWQQNLPSAIQQ